MPLFREVSFDKIAGLSFIARPAVKTAVRAAAPSTIYAIVLDPNSTSAPIEGSGNYLLSWACEPHNCGAHQWTLAIKSDGSKVAVCYYNEDLSDGARWFVGQMLVGKAPGSNCQITRIPSKVLTALGE